MTTKPQRAEASFCVVRAAGDNASFEDMQIRIENTLNCTFEWGKYRSERGYLTRILGMVIVFDHFVTVNGEDVYILWGQTDVVLLESKTGLWHNVDNDEWIDVDLNSYMITVLESGGCGVWRPRVLPQDEQAVEKS